jgi:hypothetical protein
MILEPCACGATDCRRCYPLSWKDDQTEFYLDLALEKAIETIIFHGQYPARGRARFDLYDFLLENRDPSYFLELFVTALSNNKQDLLDHAGRERKIVENLLLEHLMGSDFVAEIAAEYEEDYL